MNNQTERELLLSAVEKIDELKDKFNDHRIENQRQHSEMDNNLREHMARSEYNEQQVEILKTEIKPVLESFSSVKLAFVVLTFMVGIVGVMIKFIR